MVNKWLYNPGPHLTKANSLNLVEGMYGLDENSSIASLLVADLLARSSLGLDVLGFINTCTREISEDILVDGSRGSTTEGGGDPKDPLVLPLAHDQGRAERTSGVDGAAGVGD